MASAKDLKKRITSVKNTQQITRAMKMVSAAKLRRAQDAVTSIRPYAAEMKKVISVLSQCMDENTTHPLLTKNLQSKHESVLYVVVTSDRGLCGAFNANVIKTANRIIRTSAHKYTKFDCAYIGKKGYEFFKNKQPGKYYAGFFTGLDYKKCEEFSKDLIDLYLRGEYEEIKIIYTEFKSVIAQKVVIENFLPIKVGDSEHGQTIDQTMTIYEPSPREILDKLLPRHFAFQVYKVLRESLASEYAARMTAMENATKNAGEMMKKITLLYNKTRQAGITKELLEIVSGSEAQKG